ncbi:unnamed protein product [Somion occarium]|uniref:TOG domain-containing protein n=1 Tax=Somion occarium TaxID=3059160 RepID=A0ABP1E2D7_9APHY
MSTQLEYKLQPLRDKISLPESEETWDAIAKAISKLTTLMQDEGADYPTELVQTLRSLSRPLSGAALSERTRLSGTALELFKSSAEILGKDFTGLIPLFLPTLLTLCTRPNKVVMSRAKACILGIIESTQAPTILSYLAESAKDKSATLRLAAAECALACLNGFNPPDLEKETRAREVEALIKCTATDASADVRKVSRKIFDAYKILLPNRVDGFTSPLTPTIRKYLDIRSRAPSASSNPPSRPASSQSTHSVNSLHAITRPRSTVPSSSSSTHLSKSSSSRNGDGQGHGRTASGASLTHSESGHAVTRMTASSSNSSVRPLVGPSRPRHPPMQRGPSRAEGRDMPPPQSLPLRPHASPTSSTASDYFADVPTSSAKTPGPIRPMMGPSRVPHSDSQDPSAAPPKPRVIGGARRVLLPDPALAVKDPTEASTSKPPSRPGPSRSITAPASEQTKKPTSGSSATAKVVTKPVVRKPDIVRPRTMPSSSSTAAPGASASRSGVASSKTVTSGSTAITVRKRTTSSGRLTEPTQSQLARARATTKVVTNRKVETAKPIPGRSVAAKGAAPVNGIPVGKSKTEMARSTRAKAPVPPKDDPEVHTIPETVVEAAKMVPLPPSPKLTPSPPPSIVEAALKEIEVDLVVSSEEDSEAEPVQQVEAGDVVTPKSKENTDEEEVDDEDTIREMMDDPQELPQIFQTSPSTPQAKFPKPQAIPETPISALLMSIQKGFEFSPAPPFDPDQTSTFGR